MTEGRPFAALVDLFNVAPQAGHSNHDDEEYLYPDKRATNNVGIGLRRVRWARGGVSTNRLLGTGPETWFLATESPERTVMDGSEAGEARSDFIGGIAVNVDRGRSDTG